ncbi:MAG: hypothetical protein U5L98_08455 [Halomonas sp.]|uniref:hypothetical protein n=1 Tax=Halomonas sp. TaxID=1486246 RepID=UPI002ACE7993|nr:hypothetical protein [Halomonas sp.]MDZ7852659.1 hypothetical protein [Halomonas sp.]
MSVRGEYALRGEVLDIFLAGHDEPVRIVFEFDEVERITFFDPLTQSSSMKVDEVDIIPMREVVWDEERIAVLERQLAELPETPEGGGVVPDELREKGRIVGEELYYPLAFDEPAAVTDYLAEYGVVVYADYERLVSGADALEREYDGLYRKARRDGNPPRPERILSTSSLSRPAAAPQSAFTCCRNGPTARTRCFPTRRRGHFSGMWTFSKRSSPGSRRPDTRFSSSPRPRVRPSAFPTCSRTPLPGCCLMPSPRDSARVT